MLAVMTYSLSETSQVNFSASPIWQIAAEKDMEGAGRRKETNYAALQNFSPL